MRTGRIANLANGRVQYDLRNQNSLLNRRDNFFTNWRFVCCSTSRIQISVEIRLFSPEILKYCPRRVQLHQNHSLRNYQQWFSLPMGTRKPNSHEIVPIFPVNIITPMVGGIFLLMFSRHECNTNMKMTVDAGGSET